MLNRDTIYDLILPALARLEQFVPLAIVPTHVMPVENRVYALKFQHSIKDNDGLKVYPTKIWQKIQIPIREADHRRTKTHLNFKTHCHSVTISMSI